MNCWCEVFKTGWHKGSKGKPRYWGIKDLDRLVDTYNPEHFHEAPIVIDHNEEEGPVLGGPAYGWVEKLKRVGEILYAKFKQVIPEFKEVVNKGLFKKRSIGVFADGTLQHVAFLGATPPAVKGMKDYQFKQDEQACFYYSEASNSKILEEEPIDMTELERLQKKLEASENENKALKATNAEKDKALKTSQAQFSEQQAKSLRKDLENEIDQAIKDGKALPAWKDMGIIEFAANLENSESFEFSEGKKESPLDWFRGFLNSLGEHSLFSEFATKNKGQSESDQFSQGNQSIVEMMVSAGNGGVQ